MIGRPIRNCPVDSNEKLNTLLSQRVDTAKVFLAVSRHSRVCRFRQRATGRGDQRVGQMDALVLRDVATGPRVETVDHDGPKPGEALVRMKASGICGSDIRVIGGTSNVTFLPAVLGHEGSGIVEAVGPGVSEIGPGSRVAIGMFVPAAFVRPAAAAIFTSVRAVRGWDRVQRPHA